MNLGELPENPDQDTFFAAVGVFDQLLVAYIPLQVKNTCKGIAELLSLATLQATASGLPVIAANAGALPKLV